MAAFYQEKLGLARQLPGGRGESIDTPSGDSNTETKYPRLDPNNPRSHIYLATAYEQMGQYQRAIQVFQHALDGNMETDRIYSRLGIDYLHLNQTDKAVDAMARANRLNPSDLNNLRNLGMAYVQLGRVNDAEKAFRAAVSAGL